MSDKSSAEIACDAIAAARKSVAEGERLIQKAHGDFGLRLRSGDDPLYRAWQRGAWPARRPPPLNQPAMEGQPSLLEMVENIIASHHMGRPVAAASCLATLRERYKALDTKAAEPWDEFISKHLEPALGLDLIHEMIGKMVHKHSILRCTKCGAETRCACGCGVVYLGEDNWSFPTETTAESTTAMARAKAAIAAHPEKSNRKIAKEIGVGVETVRRARDGSPDGSPASRVGRDGKSYRSRPADPDDDSDSPKGQYNAYMLRADAARSFATYQIGPIDDDAIDIARDTAATWAALAEELKQQQAKRRKRR